MAWRNIHTQPFRGTPRDVLALLHAYHIPLLVLTMIGAFTVGFTAYLLQVIRMLLWLQSLPALANVPSVAAPVTFLLLGDALFGLLVWSFLRAMLTCGGYVPKEPWCSAPQVDALKQQRVRAQWARQQQWLERNRYEMAVMRYQQQLQFMRQFMGVSAPAIHLQPPTPPPSILAQQQRQQDEQQQQQQKQQQQPNVGGRPPPALPTCSSDTTTTTTSDSCADTYSSSTTSATTTTTTSSDSTHPRDLPPPREGSGARGYDGRAVQPLSPAEDSSNPFSVEELEADGSLRFCHRCSQFKPDRSHHCRLCDRCGAGMDHHCVYLNNCIGLFNYKFFFLTITYGSLCGWLCTAMFLDMYRVVARIHGTSKTWGSIYRGHYSEYIAYLRQVDEVQRATLQSPLWLLCPTAMALVGCVVFYLWTEHAYMLWLGVTTLERMQQVSVERFLRAARVQQYGHCAPETNRCCAAVADATARARCLLRGVRRSGAGDDDDEDAAYARMMEEAPPPPGADGSGGLGYRYGPELASDGALLPQRGGGSFALQRRDAESGCGGEDPQRPQMELRRRHFRRLFGRSWAWYAHLLPLRPRHTGVTVGEADRAPDGQKSV